MPNLIADPSYPKMPVFEFLSNSARLFPYKPFILHPQTMTFKELDVASNKLASELVKLGIGKGTQVGLFMWNSPEFIISFFGVLKTGATVTALNPSFKEREAKYQLEDSEAVAVIVEDDLYPIIRKIRGDLKNLKEVVISGMKRYPDAHSFTELIERGSQSPPRVKIDPMEDLAVIQYTAGPTGPRGCMLTHMNLVSNVLQVSSAGLVTQEDIMLANLPFYHIYGMMTEVLLGVHIGAGGVIQKRFDLLEVLELIEKYRITVVLTVMPAIIFMTEYPEFVKGRDISSLRFVLNGATPIVPSAAKKFTELYGITISNGYGLSEASPVTHTNPLSRIKVESVGTPIQGTEQRIVDLATGMTDLPPGEVGEIVVRGPQVMKGYWKRPEETAQVLKDGWLYTGDIGRIDEEGYLYILDRKKEIIKYKGFTIGPTELESILKEHPAVEECVVIGKPDLIGGEVPKAFVVRKMGVTVTEKELMLFVDERVAGYKKLREVEFTDLIPRSPEGKVLRRWLIERERIRAGLPRGVPLA